MTKGISPKNNHKKVWIPSILSITNFVPLCQHSPYIFSGNVVVPDAQLYQWSYHACRPLGLSNNVCNYMYKWNKAV